MSIKTIIVSLLLIIFVSSCKTIERIEYIDKYHTIEKSDTLIQYDRDSIFVDQFVKGDTVFKTKYVEKIKYKDRIVIERDTIKVDSVIKEVEVKKVVPEWCYKTIIGLILLVLVLVIWIYIKRN